MLPSLPKIMVAPNGAKRGKIDHPALPITIPEIVETAKACHLAGADGIHIHVRDADGGHVLDAGLYREVLDELKHNVPDMTLQITTEAVGLYSPQQQRQLVRDVQPEFVSISVREMLSNGRLADSSNFYQQCDEANIAVQHIAYDAADLSLLDRHVLPDAANNSLPQVLFVLGRYSKDQQSQPDDLSEFYDWLKNGKREIDWAVCAFGKSETDCLAHAASLGGKVRVGFENSLWNSNGEIAKDNAERVREVVNRL